MRLLAQLSHSELSWRSTRLVVSIQIVLLVLWPADAVEILVHPDSDMPEEAYEAFEWAAKQYEKVLKGNAVLQLNVVWETDVPADQKYLAACCFTVYKWISVWELKEKREGFIEDTRYGTFWIPIPLWQQLYPDDWRTVWDEAQGIHMRGNNRMYCIAAK